MFEVCHLTAVNNDMLTVVRGQEGTAAKGWSLNDVIANFATRGSENQFVQIEQLQSGHYTSAVAGGTANGLTLALPATFFLNGSTEWALKTPILIYPTLNNTGASTLQLTMGGRVMGTYPLVKGSNTALRAGISLPKILSWQYSMRIRGDSSFLTQQRMLIRPVSQRHWAGCWGMSHCRCMDWEWGRSIRMMPTAT